LRAAAISLAGFLVLSGATVSPSLFNALARGVDTKLVTERAQATH